MARRLQHLIARVVGEILAEGIRLAREHGAPSQALSRELVERTAPDVAAELRAEGARIERDRIKGVCNGSPFAGLHPLVEQLAFDGLTQPSGAALLFVKHVQTEDALRFNAIRLAIDATYQASRTARAKPSLKRQ